MLASITANYLMGIAVERSSAQKIKKLILVLAVICNLAALGWFKYAGLMADTLRLLPAFSAIPAVSVVLPIGISFYTFQAMSYVVDVYRGDCNATKNYIDFAAYISLFPQLIAGPIVRYCDVAEQLQHRTITAEKFSWGVRMFCIGIAKKVLLANQFALLWETVSQDPMASGTLACWFGIAAYTLQIYFDFGGYSDMARGLGAMLGFDFCINFDYPYISRSITEFWRRWHISLSSWFRDYVYIPLGGSRKGQGRTACNLLIVWMLTGFWHGAGWNFLLWGLYYGLLLLLEKFVLRSLLDRVPQFFRWLYTILLVMIGWVFFASSDLSASIGFLHGLFSLSPTSNSAALWGWVPLLCIGAVAATPVFSGLWKKWEGTSIAAVVETVLCLLAMVFAVASLVSGSYNPFLYFRF
jgi:alginate O-acetyltransferase complex protein AlgI